MDCYVDTNRKNHEWFRRIVFFAVDGTAKRLHVWKWPNSFILIWTITEFYNYFFEILTYVTFNLRSERIYFNIEKDLSTLSDVKSAYCNPAISLGESFSTLSSEFPSSTFRILSITLKVVEHCFRSDRNQTAKRFLNNRF